MATFVLDSDPSNINYHAGSGSTPENHIISATNDRLTLYNDETGEYEPMLLESWEHNEDCTEWTMHLRKGVKWHDGVEFTAHDVAFTFEYMHDPNIDGRQTTYYGDPNETIEVVDDYTYKIITDYPNPSAPLARWTTVIPKHIWEKVDPSNFSKAKEGYLTVGLGPIRWLNIKLVNILNLKLLMLTMVGNLRLTQYIIVSLGIKPLKLQPSNLGKLIV